MPDISHEYYELHYDDSKNRIYFNCMGDWTSRAVAPDFLTDWQSVMANCRPGWTLLGDLTKVGQFSEDADLMASIIIATCFISFTS